MMLTKIVGQRVYDFSHVVGGRDQVMGPLALASGRDNELYAIVSALGGGRGITKYTAGHYPGEEEMIQRIGESGEGPGQLMWTSGIALDSDYNIYVTDAWTDRISVFDESGGFVRSFGSSGDGDGQFRRPSGITIDQDDNLLVVDTLNDKSSEAQPRRPISVRVWQRRVGTRTVQVSLGHHHRLRRLHLRCRPPEPPHSEVRRGGRVHIRAGQSRLRRL